MLISISSHIYMFHPSLSEHPQADMGMTYSELSVIGRLRKISKCGPFSMFCKLIHTWKDVLSPTEVSQYVTVRDIFLCCVFYLFFINSDILKNSRQLQARWGGHVCALLNFVVITI